MASPVKNGKIAPRYSIGVFDSGLGGLTVVRAIQRALPSENICYFGDIARLPYGIKSVKQIIEFSIQNSEFLIRKRIKALVVACNSSSSASLGALKKNYSLPIIDVISPAAQLACDVTTSRRVGVIGTTATIESDAYKKAIHKINPKIKVFQAACPLFVSLVESGWMNGPITENIVKNYLKPLLRSKVDTLILGCTHYPLLHRVIRRVIGKKITLIDSAPSTSKRLLEVLKQRNLLNGKNGRKGKLEVYVSDLPRDFLKIGARFLGHPIHHLKTVSL